MSKQVARADLGCSFREGEQLVYARDPNGIDAFPLSADDPNHAEGNLWRGTVVETYSPDRAGSVDARTGEVDQCVYAVVDPYTTAASGVRQVKATNVRNEAPARGSDPFAPWSMKDVYSKV